MVGPRASLRPPVVTRMDRWEEVPESLGLPPGEVHVYRVGLEIDDSTLGRLADSLSDDEHSRARRFALPRLRRHFVAGRGILRALLGRYLEEVPSAVVLRYGPHGKPALAANQVGVQLTFNLSHSAGLLLLAVARGGELGIDLERIRPQTRFLDIARRFFSPAETTALLALSEGLQREGFFRCWTRKEAFLKAHGGGLRVPLDSFEVSVDPRAGARLLGASWDPSAPLRWRLHDLEPGPGFVAALAVEQHQERLRCFTWDPRTVL